MPELLRLGRGPYFARLFSIALLVAVIAYPPSGVLALHRHVSCEDLPWVAGSYFAGLQVLVCYWAVLRLLDAGLSPGLALLTWTGALPGLARATAHDLGATTEWWCYAAAVGFALLIGALEPRAESRSAHPGVYVEGVLGRYWRRLMLPLVLLDVLVLAPNAGIATPKAWVEDGFAMAPFLMQAVQDRWERSGSLPNGNFAAGLPPPESITGNAVVAAGVDLAGHIYIDYDHPDLPCDARGRRLALVPEVEIPKNLVWRCAGSLPRTLWPAQCLQGTVRL